MPGVKAILLRGSTFEGRPNVKVINWGNSVVSDEVAKCQVINDPSKVKLVINKIEFFKAIDLVPERNRPRIPKWTTDARVAIAWANEGHEVVGRQLVESNSGKGIIFSSDGDREEFANCRLYTRYIKKKMEYRVHVAFGETIFIQKKVLRRVDDLGNPIAPVDVDFRVRSHLRGFIFVHNEVNPPQDVIDQALKAVQAVGLDFGAVDVIWNAHEQRAYVLEINSAPGLEGETVQAYVRAFEEHL